MDRSQLRNMIESGRSMALDCYSISKTIPRDDSVGRLFQTDILNKSVLMKRYEPALTTARQDIIVGTVVYFPYDYDNPYDGGESLEFNDFGFSRALTHKIAHGTEPDSLIEQVDRDVDVLKMVNAMHSLDPFMFKSKAEQLEKADGIHPAYFSISPAEWDKIRLPIREKIAKLVTKALGGLEEGGDNAAREEYIERFLTKIWQAKDIEGIEPFVKAMQIPPEQAPNVFFAWKAVCYYQVRFNEIAEDLKTLFHWVGNNQLCFPVDAHAMQKSELNAIVERRERLRAKMRESHLMANAVIVAYEDSYNQFIEHDRPQKFMAFLENSANSYLNLASHVSTGSHSVNLWKFYMDQFEVHLRRQQFMELFDGLALLNNVNVQSTAGSDDFLVG